MKHDEFGLRGVAGREFLETKCSPRKIFRRAGAWSFSRRARTWRFLEALRSNRMGSGVVAFFGVYSSVWSFAAVAQGIITFGFSKRAL